MAPKAKARVSPKAKASAASSEPAVEDGGNIVSGEPSENATDGNHFSVPELDSQGYRVRFITQHPGRMLTIGGGKRLHIDCNCVLQTQLKHPAKLRSFKTCPCVQRLNMSDELLIDEKIE